MMSGLTNIVGRIPRFMLFAVAGLIQVGLIALMVFDRVGILREGSEVKLKTRPVDPRDFLRGDYVVLNYDISSVPASELKDQPASGRHANVYVKLAPNAEGFHSAVSVHREPVTVTAPEVLIRGRVVSGANCGGDVRLFCDRLQLNYGIERYFVPEGEGTRVEQARRDGQVTIVAAVTSAGRAAIKRLLVDGKPVYDEPMF
jgi:uncharacterized membrane-anchored protein